MTNQENTKLTDKAFSKIFTVTLVSIIICIICLCSSTYAWYIDSTSSKQNQLVASPTNLQVTVTYNENEVLNVEKGVTFLSGVEYKVTLSLPPNYASGYVIIKTESGDVYYSNYIQRHTEENNVMVTFTLTVSNTKKLYFIKRWGIYAGESSVVHGKLHI